MEGEGCGEEVVGVAAVAGCQAHILAENGPVVGVCNGDEGFGSLEGRLVAQVRHALFRDNGVDVVFRVVDVRTEGHNRRNAALLGRRAAGEGREHGVAREVARAAHAVEHLRAADLGGIDVAVDVDLHGRVERTDAEAGNDFGAVGNLRGAEQDASAVEVDVVVEVAELLGAERERAGGGIDHATLADEAHGLLLEHLGVDVEIGHFGTAAQGTHHGVCPAAHAALERELVGGDVALAHVPHEEVGGVLPDEVRFGRAFGHGAGLVG